tara:strand:+ start:306 stop:695 length:390 start_codon:yes stop_codon:yes gene_type:complete
MTQYALIKTSTSEVKEIVDGDKRFRTGEPPALNSDKDLHWLTFVKVDPDVDHATQIKTGPVDVVSRSRLTRTWTVRDKTDKELDDIINANVTDRYNHLSPLIDSLNDKSFVVGSEYTTDQIKAILKAKM